jgi:hypothetical protein
MSVFVFKLFSQSSYCSYNYAPNNHTFIWYNVVIFLVSWGGVRQSTRYGGHHLAYCTSLGLWMMLSAEQSVE